MTLPRADLPQRRSPGHGAEVHVAADEVHHALRGAFGHDRLQLDAGLLSEEFRQQLPERAGAGRDVVDRLAAPAKRDEFRKRAHAERRVHDEHIRRPADIGDMGEVLERIKTGIGIHHRRDHVIGGARGGERVAVGRRLRRGRGADQPAGAGAILHEAALVQGLAELLAQQAREHVGGPAGRRRRDDADRPRRPVGGRRRDRLEADDT